MTNLSTDLAQKNVFSTIFIGAGPAGLGSLVYAEKNNILQQLLDSKIAIIEKSSTLGMGTIGKYEINSDTPGGGFLECLSNESHIFKSMLELPETKYFSEHADTYVPLKLVGSYMNKLGDCLESAINSHPTSKVFKNTEVISIHLLPNKIKLIKSKTLISKNEYTEKEYYAKNIIIATGAKQNRNKILSKNIAELGVFLDKKYDKKVILSDEVLSGTGINQIKKLLKHPKNKIIVLGAFHSAFASIVSILKNTSEHPFDNSSINILYNDPPKVYYQSKEDAFKEGYKAFNKNDICPRTNRVFRFGGLRMESRDLLRKIMGLHPQVKEKRVILTKYPKNPNELEFLLNEATVIIAALGYNRLEIPIFHGDGEKVELRPNEEPFVDNTCNVLTQNGEKLQGIYGVGLASGYTPEGGEASFSGHTNSIWIYQNPTAKNILKQVM